ncbi:MAG: ferrochelatase [Betaproteobacteria bacterium]|nr:ferrochelatase [Betaproteobacteria bacterium]
MPHYLPEPPFSHKQDARTGILLINLGTPAAPTAQAVRPYLREFLWDRRVVEIPRPIWWLILHGIILVTRPKKSAEKYASIWRPEGSPLMHHTQRQAQLLGEELARRLPETVVVDWAMRYGQPSVASRIQSMKAQGVDRLLVLPLYPQYAASSSGSALDAVWQALLKTRTPPDVRTLRHFHDHPGYIAALRQSIEVYWAEHGRPEILVMSFHGVPRRTLDLGDPYHCECRKTGRLLAEALNLKEEHYRITFQSRFGAAEWLSPYTDKTLEELGRQKTRRVDVVCPGFVADCLETLEEIGMEGKATFLSAGGGEYRHIPALNERPLWISALADLAQSQLNGWLERTETEAGSDLKMRTQRALALGAKN